MNLAEFLNRLEGVKGRDGQYMAKCPAHQDSKPSLSVGVGEDNRILFHCQAGCATEDVLAALGLKQRDLFADLRPGDVFPAYDTPREQHKAGSSVVATYDFFDDKGRLIAQKLRREDKSFTWRRPDGKGGWIYNRQGVAHRLFVAGELKECITVAEGEKDALTLHSLGFNAASGADGAGPGKWRKEYTEQLRGLQVFVFQDNDKVGKEYAAETCRALHGVAASVRLLDLSAVWPEIPEHGDVSDMVAAFGLELAAEKIAALMVKTKEWVPTAEQGAGYKLVKASEIPYEPPRWSIAPYFQRGKGTLIQGDNGSGKTAFMCAIAAHMTTGRPLLGISIEAPGDVLILSVEDDLPVLRGRIEASGGNLDKCHFLTNAAGLTFNSPEIESAIKQIKAKMVIFDPFQAYLGARVDMFRSNETRPEMAKLFEMCERNDCSCAIIAHMGKGGGERSAVNRALGSVDIPASMRSILQLTRNPENEDECVMVHVKCSNAPKGQSIAYTIGDRGGVHWVGFSPMTVEDLNCLQKRKEKGVPYEREPLVQVFNQLITDKPGGGFWSYEDVRSIGAKLLGFPPFYSVADLKQKLNSSFCRELQEKDGLIVTYGAKGKGNVRGIKIEQYQVPHGYQTRITEAK